MSPNTRVQVALLFKFVALGPLWVLRDVTIEELPPAYFRDDERVVLMGHSDGPDLATAIAKLTKTIETAPDLAHLCDAFGATVLTSNGAKAAARALRVLALTFVKAQYERYLSASRGD